jgi:hypothetical protein
MGQCGWVVDAVFMHPRLVEVYDWFDPDRSDLDAYVGMVEEFNATRVLTATPATYRRCRWIWRP